MTSFTLLRTTVIIFYGLLLMPLSLASPPTHDHWRSALTITALPETHQQNTQQATDEENEALPSCAHASASVWYQYTPSVDQTLVVDTLGSDYDTVLSVWSGKNQPTTELICNNDSHLGEAQSQVILKLSAHLPYYLNISGKEGATGQLMLHAYEFVSPLNDTLDQAMTIDTLPYTHAQYTYGTTMGNKDSRSACTSTTANVWYQYIPNHDQEVIFDTHGSDYDTVLSVWNGTSFPLTEVDCNDNKNDLIKQSQVQVKLTAGTAYYLKIGGINNVTGALILNAQEFLPPTNDKLSEAMIIHALPYHSTQSTLGASIPGPKDTISCGASGGNVWYQYIPERDQLISFDTQGSNFYTLLSVWEGVTPFLREIACSDHVGQETYSQLSLKLTAHTSYSINIGGVNGDNGHLVFNVHQLSTPSNDDLANAVVINNLPFYNTQSTQGTTNELNEVTLNDYPPGESGVWYQYTPDHDQSVRFDTIHSNYDVLLSVWTGKTHPLKLVYHDDPFIGHHFPLILTLTAHTSYDIRISSMSHGMMSHWDESSVVGDSDHLLVFNVSEVTLADNDHLNHATVIPTLPYQMTQDFQAATLEDNEVKSSRCNDTTEASVWYRYLPNHHERIILDTFDSNYDTVLSVWNGTTHPLTEIACQDNQNESFQSQVAVDLMAGAPYYFRISGLKGTNNHLVLHARMHALTSPVNDHLAQALPIFTLPYQQIQDTRGATAEVGEALTCGAQSSGPLNQGVWYQYTPDHDQIVLFETDGSHYEAVPSLWTGTVHPLTEVACQYLSLGTLIPSKVLAKLTAGIPYYLHVQGGGTLVLKGREVISPENSDFTHATAITTLPYAHSQSLEFALLDKGEPKGSCESRTTGNVWYQYTPSRDQIVSFDTFGSTYDTTLSIWSGPPSSLTEVACNENYPHGYFPSYDRSSQVVSKLTAGTSYLIKVNGDSSGTLILNAQEIELPSNNNFAQATIVTALPYSDAQNVLIMGYESEESLTRCEKLPLHAHGGEIAFWYFQSQQQHAVPVWYQYTPSTDQFVTIDTIGSDYDTILSVWEGTISPLSELVCNDNAIEFLYTSQLSVSLTAGQAYYIKVSGGPSESVYTGHLSFHLHETPPSIHDNLAQAIPITILPYHDTQAAQIATEEPGEQRASCGTLSKPMSVWYQYTPSRDQTIVLNTFGSESDTVLSVWKGSSYPLEELSCNDDHSTVKQSQTVLQLKADTTYSINVSHDGMSENLDDNLVLNAYEIPLLPSNDELSQATVIASIPYSISQSTLGASQQEGEATPTCVFFAGASVWYQYTPSEDQAIQFDTQGSNYHTVLSLWERRGTSWSEIFCHEAPTDDATQVNLKLLKDVTYYLNVSGVDGDSGTLRLDIDELIPPNNDDLDHATILSSLPYSNTQYVTHTSFQTEEVASTCWEDFTGGSVWYQYTPLRDQKVSIKTAWLSGGDEGLTLSIWQDKPFSLGNLASLRELTCSSTSDTHGPSPQASLSLMANTTYYIRLTTPQGSNHPLFLSVQNLPLPDNDALAKAIPILQLPYHHFQNLPAEGVTLEPYEVQPSCISSGGSIWYQYTPDSDQWVVFETEGPSSSSFSVWTGMDHPLTEIACSHCSQSDCYNANNAVHVKLIAHTPYYLRINPSSAGISLNVYHLDAPPHDELTHAKVISTLPYLDADITEGATLEVGESPPSCATHSGASVWYRYTPTVSQQVILNTLDSDYDTILSVWTGSTHPLTEVACQDDKMDTHRLQSKVSIALIAGTPYFINVSGIKTLTHPEGETGGLVLKVAETLALPSPELLNQLPNLGQGRAVEATGQTIETTTHFSGGASNQDYLYQSALVIPLNNILDILGKITIDTHHVGQLAEIVVYGSYQASRMERETFFMLGSDGKILPWDEQPAHLVTFQTVTLVPEQGVSIYHQATRVFGMVRVFFGYRLPDGTLVTNENSIEITTVNE